MEVYRNLLYALLSTKGPCNGGLLCQVAGVSPKTLRKNLREINDFFAAEGKVRIVSKVGVGYTLQASDENAYAALRRQIVDSYLYSQMYASSQRNRLHFITRKLLVLEHVRLEELSEEMFYSDMTLQRDMKLVKENLAHFHIALSQNAADGYKIHGDEWDIRMALICERAIYDKNAVLQQHPDTLFEQAFLGATPLETRYLTDLLLEELDPAHRFSLESLGFLAFWIQLSFARAEKRPGMLFLKAESDSTLQGRHRARCAKIYDRIRADCGLLGQPEDIIGLCILVEAWHEEKPDPQTPIRLFDERELAGYLDLYFPGIFRYEESNVHQRLFFRMVENKLVRILYCRRHRVHENNDVAKQIQGTGLLAWQICSCIAQYIKETSGFVLTQEELAHLYFVVAAYTRDHPLGTKPVRALVISALEQEHLQFLCANIRRDIRFPRLELTAATYTECRQRPLTGYDCIFTDHLGDLPQRAPGIPVVNIRFLNSYFSSSYHVGAYPLKEYLLRQLFRPGYFYKGDLRSKEEVFALLPKLIGGPLRLPKPYWEELAQQEAQLSFERNYRLAVIQPFSSLDIPDFFCVLLCRRPFRWYKREVQYIFVASCFCRPELYAHLVNQTLSGLLHDATRLAKPWETLDYESVLQAILPDLPQKEY